MMINPMGFKARMTPGHTYVLQDYIGSRITFDDGEVLELFGCADGLSLFYQWYPTQHQPYTSLENEAMYERAQHILNMEDTFSEPYEYSPGYSRVVRK